MSLSAIPRSTRKRIFERDKGGCSYCRLSQIGQGAVFHINHIIPRSRGGAAFDSNLVLQCPHCSLHKADKLSSPDPLGDNVLSRIFHPNNDSWHDHFALLNSGKCRGFTPIERATVSALHMNDALPRVARALQIRIGLLIV